MTEESHSNVAAPAAPATTAAVELRDVRMTFGGKVVHNGVNLSVRDGEIMTLVGGSGQGKTVLLKEIIGLLLPDSGEVFVHGREVTRMNSFELQEVRREVAMVFQGSALFDSMTVADNVAYGVLERNPDMPADRWMKIVSEKLGLVDMPGTEALMPAELSGGMKKRVALARALALEPKIILYDEPTTGLDPANVRRISALIVKTRQMLGVTSIMVTHDLQAVEAVTDRLAMLDQGRIIAVGTWKEMEACRIPRVCQFLAGEVED
ncbi:MAG: ATP-binding cassette domain-containing protein [Candidatus Brocadiia bacterium]|jgi:phospholipid/cholesterol/gamma-HCH transport system ATP-binding protein